MQSQWGIWAVWAIAGLATAGVIVRPGRWPAAVWAVTGALTLVVTQRVPLADSWHAIGRGLDVYMFLAGMMIVSEIARREGVFDWSAAFAVRHARGSQWRLFALIYAIGTVVTVFLSNDATAVVLTPAVYAAAKKAGARPLPYLLACAFVANAASFVLPISNPANLVIFGHHLPALSQWLSRFAMGSIAAIAVTGLVLFALHRRSLADRIEADPEVPSLSAAGRMALGGVCALAAVLLTASTLEWPLGAATLVVGALLLGAIALRDRGAILEVPREVSWNVLALVAGLFVLVEGLAQTGVIAELTDALRALAATSPDAAAWVSGALSAFGCNLVNNLPAGLVAGAVVQGADVSGFVQTAVTIGIDLGPNLSVTGSLATLLWLEAIRREGETVSGFQFLKVGAVVMPSALALALAAAWAQSMLSNS